MKWRILALTTILAVMFTAAPAFAGHLYVPRRVVHRQVWAVPFDVPPPPRHYYYRPPVYVPPRVLPGYYAPHHGHWVPGPYYYDPGLDIGVQRGGFGLHIDF